jgi:selenide, water dikinase
LVQTVDFFTPIVDDPYTFGAIAATNSLSDVYAMGGEPLTAMNILCWPHKLLPPEALAELLRGGADKVREAGAMLVGGHSVRDKELKFGLSVTGVVNEDAVWTNAGARPGDALVLTKALGTGVIATAVKREICPEEAEDAATESMLRLNRDAKRAAAEGVVHGCTDITGFGLLGHAWELARASRARVRLYAASLPLLPSALDLASRGVRTGGAASNRAYVGEALRAEGVDAALLDLALDPQTSGGLLLSVPPADAARLAALGVGVIIGEVLDGPAEVTLCP